MAAVEATASFSTEIIMPPGEEELREPDARRLELDRLEEVGFLASFSDLESQEVKRGTQLGGGGSGGVFCVDVLNRELEKRAKSFTRGGGLAMKTVLKVRGGIEVIERDICHLCSVLGRGCCR